MYANVFNENVNQEFIANSYLYLAIRSPYCRAGIVKQLILMGCPLMNSAVPLEQHDFHPFFTLLRRTRTVPYGFYRAPRYRRNPLKFFNEEGATLYELGTAMLAKQDPLYDHEVAIRVDMSMDSCHHSKEAVAFKHNYLRNSRNHPEVWRLALASGRMFGAIYTFQQDRIPFWTSKTLQLLFNGVQLGLATEMQQTTSQLHAFLPASQVPLRVADIADERTLSTTGFATSSNLLNTYKFSSKGSRETVLQHAEALQTLLLGACFLRLNQAPRLPWLNVAIGQACGIAELFLREKDPLPLIAVKEFFKAFNAFQRHSCTTFMHYLAKYPVLTSDLSNALQGVARLYAHCLDRKGLSPLTIAARAANLHAFELLLQAEVPVRPGDPYIALQGPAHNRLQPLRAEEETMRIEVFMRLRTQLNGCEPVGEDLSGYDQLFVQEKTMLQGSEESLGYPIILA
jgi:hypothetical protein